MGSVDPAPVADRDHPQSSHQLVGLHRDDPPPVGLVLHIDHVQAGGIEHLISAGAPGRTDAASTLRHVGASGDKSAWSLLILEAPTPTPADRHAPRLRRPQPRSDPKSHIPSSPGVR